MDANDTTKPKIFQIVGFSNTGKTTLISSIIQKMHKKNLNIATIKSASTHEILNKDKDAEKNFFAGAVSTAVLFTNGTQILLRELSLEETVNLIVQFSSPDIIIIEGFKRREFPKIIVWSKNIDLSLFNLNNVIGVYCTEKVYKENKPLVDQFLEEKNCLLFFSDEQITNHILEVL